jgi:hypothetical protein
MLELARMSDPLSIPDDKRADGRISLFDPPGRRWPLWIIIAIIVGLNLWFDYYHPLGRLFDIIVVVIGLVVWGRQKR